MTGIEGGLVVVSGDDPSMHSSQNEQDSRNYARFAKVALFEPSDSQEAKDFTILALQISEEFRAPVILRSTTRVSHSRSLVEMGERSLPQQKVGLIKNPPRFVPIPVWGRPMRRKVEERLAEGSAGQCIFWGLSRGAYVLRAGEKVWPVTVNGDVAVDLGRPGLGEGWKKIVGVALILVINLLGMAAIVRIWREGD